MTHYRVSAPQRQGNIWVVEIEERQKGLVLRKTTVRTDHFSRIIKALFHSIPEDYPITGGIK